MGPKLMFPVDIGPGLSGKEATEGRGMSREGGSDPVSAPFGLRHRLSPFIDGLSEFDDSFRSPRSRWHNFRIIFP
jgi:hypothetical protein